MQPEPHLSLKERERALTVAVKHDKTQDWAGVEVKDWEIGEYDIREGYMANRSPILNPIRGA